MEIQAPLVTRLRPGQVLALEAGLAAAYGGAAWVLFAHKDPHVVALLGTLLSALAIVLTRRHPVWGFVNALVPLALMPAASSLGFVAVLPLCYALFWVAGVCKRRTGLAVLAVAQLGAVATGLPRFEHVGAIVPFAVMFTAAWVTGYVVAQQRRYGRELVLQQERMRIARELHDIVAHSMSVITVQAGYGHLVIDEQPAEARHALAAIEAAGRQTLTEMRRLLGVLRSEQDGPAALGPAPGLSQLDQLIEQTGRAGVRVRLTVTGEPVDLLAGIDLSAYRIVQEALTNVVKHAATGTAEAVVDYRPTELAIRVTDSGSGCPDGMVANGHGLVGIRERVTLYGGSLRAGPLPDRGFEVSARLPLTGYVG
ncbi:sensor histidine kinase [Kribbella sp. NPDC006257]|uniref:sensor histidine kinase n=1 Tax=Kribbella sp. NPDC006257 TaxID=3156738 RepID=UPI00339DF4AA